MCAFVLYVGVQLPSLFLFYTTSIKNLFYCHIIFLSLGNEFSTFEKLCSVTCLTDRVSSQY